jgi:hypothetical protein
MGISFAINVLDLIKGVWGFIKKMNKKEEESSSTPNEPMPSEEEIRQEYRKRIEEQIKILSGKNKTLHSLAIRELERIAENPDMNQELKQYICESLCQYLSKHPDSRPAFDALFKKDRIFVAMEKEIKNAKFVKLNLSEFHTIENVNFINCSFSDCHFHEIHFRNCNMHGGEIRKCDFKDGIKFDECFFKDIHIDNSYFRHVFFRGLSVRGGKLSSSVFLRSELFGASFINIDVENMAFHFCKFQMEDFNHCQMTNVKFKYKNNEAERLDMMQKYLSHMGYQPCIERSSMTLIVG